MAIYSFRKFFYKLTKHFQFGVRKNLVNLTNTFERKCFSKILHSEFFESTDFKEHTIYTNNLLYIRLDPKKKKRF